MPRTSDARSGRRAPGDRRRPRNWRPDRRRVLRGQRRQPESLLRRVEEPRGDVDEATAAQLTVAPAELEALLLSHPEVVDAAVVPAPDEEAGEVPVAFVVTRRGTGDERRLIQYVSDRVAAHKRVRRVRFVDEIPKSPSGKILRRHLKALV